LQLGGVIMMAAAAGCGSDVERLPPQRHGGNGVGSTSSTSSGGTGGSAPAPGMFEFQTGATLEAMAIAADGAIYLALRYVGDTSLGGKPLASLGSADMALVKLDPSGAVEWARTLGGTGDEFVGGLALAPGGDLVLCGVAFAPLDLGGGPLSPQYFSAFVARFTSSGEPVWSTLFDESQFSDAEYCAIDSSGRIVVVLYGPPETPAPVLASYSPDGELLWTRYNFDSGFYFPSGVGLDATGQPTVASTFDGTIDLGSGPLTSDGQFDIAVVSYSESGELQWVTQIGEADADLASGIATTAAGFAVAGAYGVKYIPNDPNYAASASDAFVAELAPDGAVLWKWLLGSAAVAEADTIVESSDHGVWVGGVESLPSRDQGFLVRVDKDGATRSSVAVSPMTRVVALARSSGSTIIAGGDDAVWGGPNGPVAHAIYLMTVDETEP